jgi:hypothetical protein
MEMYLHKPGSEAITEPRSDTRSDTRTRARSVSRGVSRCMTIDKETLSQLASRSSKRR